jgi:hypothetical protein
MSDLKYGAWLFGIWTGFTFVMGVLLGTQL